VRVARRVFSYIYLTDGLALFCLSYVLTVFSPLVLSAPDDSLKKQYREGIAAYHRGEYARAQGQLRRTFTADRSLMGKQGSVAYWLALSYQKTGHTDSSNWAARTGTRAILKHDNFDARLFDFYLSQTVSPHSESSPKATELYFRLLRRVGPDLPSKTQSVLREVVAQLRPLVGDETLEKHVVRGSSSSPEGWAFRKGAGLWLLTWWRRQDPVPKTEKNERAEEHLRRVDRAVEKFASQRRIAGWDDRGDVYVRYGRPDQKYSIKFDDMGFLSEVVRSGVPVSRSDFPRNVIWKYPALSSSGKYLFVRNEKRDEFELSTALELLPAPLRGPFGPGNRQQNVAYSSMAALRYVYSQLSLQYHDRGNTLSKLNGWFSYQASRRRISDLSGKQGGREIGFGPGARRVFGGSGPEKGYPSSAATASISNVRNQERQFSLRRTREMPRTHSPAGEVGQRLPVEYRVARFLGREGTTRTEVYWGGRTGPFANADSSTGVEMTIVRHGSQYRRLGQASRGYSGDQIIGDGWEGTAPQRTVMNGGRDTHHLSLQWDWRSREKPRRPAGQRLGMFAARVDTLQPLRADASELEMSDLRLMSVPPSVRDEGGSILQKTVPYPYDTVPPQTPLFLYFEIYHLGQSAQGQTRYTVTYEARRQTRKGFLGRLFGDDTQTEVTSTTAEYTGRKRRTEEYLQLDLEADPKRPQSTQVTVRVTDNVTGNEIERSISLTLTPSEGGR
jgi:GWxTD domain-containing protein